MRSATAGAIGGLVAGAVISGARTLGHDAGLLRGNLSETAQDWLDDTFDTRARFGEDGAEFAEQAGHYAACTGMGAAYGMVRPYLPIPGLLSGAIFGAAVYAVGVAGVLPELGVTPGEPEEEPGVPTERFALHVLFGAVIGLVADALNDRRVKVARHRLRLNEID